jgi:hypothetical protein
MLTAGSGTGQVRMGVPRLADVVQPHVVRYGDLQHGIKLDRIDGSRWVSYRARYKSRDLMAGQHWGMRMPVRYSGHETFACRYAWLPKALQAIQSNPSVFANEDQAMVELGVGKNMVRAIRFWVEASGMAGPATKARLEPTPLGRHILGPKGLDPFMEDIQTLWLIHWNLATQTEHPLFAWEFLFGRWHEPEFTESMVLKAFAKETNGLSKKLSPVTLQQHLHVFLHTYVPTRGRKGDIAEDNLDCPLTELEMLIKVGEREIAGQARRETVFAFRREDKPSLSAELFAYCVNDFWRKMLPNEQTLSVRTLVSGPGSPGQVFKISEEDIYARLTDLAAATEGRLKYSESAALPQIHRAGIIDDERLLTRVYH